MQGSYTFVSLNSRLESNQKNKEVNHHGCNPGANPKSISHICYIREVALNGSCLKKQSVCPWVVSRVD